MRFPRFVPILVCITLNTFSLFAQSPNGNINGLVSDPSSAAVVGAEVVAVNDVTRVQYPTKTNSEGIYVLPNLPPGPYRVEVSKIGFKTLVKPDITLNVQDSLSINFTLVVGAFHEIVTIEGGAPLVNTESATVSTVVDRGYVENMPLNGRSFQDLILLTPGVVTNNPQTAATAGETGEFSVNGQRTESNYYTVDGVSANIGISQFAAVNAAGPSGSLPGPTALGTTQGLVSVDALQEFRVQSSTYSAEYGRNPGGQFSLVTRSGANEWHGTVFDYLRNTAFDANDWFNSYFDQPRPAERQDDFGGTLGGPFRIPGGYDGKDRTFFFFSYEGLRLDQPQAANVTYVPDASLRASSPAPLEQVLKAFPVANGADLGNGLAEFIDSWSNPASIDATSVRLDHALAEKLRLFFRFSNTNSAQATRDTGLTGVASILSPTAVTTRTYTFGATSLFSPTISNEFRMNYSSNVATASAEPSDFGGAIAANLNQIQGVGGSEPAPNIEVGLYLGSEFPTIVQSVFDATQKQWNIVDSLLVSKGKHQLKFGIDYRRLSPSLYASSPVAIYRYFSQGSVTANSVDLGVGISNASAFPIYANFSSFVQDELKLTSRLALSIGLRWEVNPAPGASKGNLPYTVQGSGLASLALAPQGTPLWKTSWFNLAPRLGAAYLLRNDKDFETVVRAGIGVFFDTGQQLGSYGYQGPGFSAMNFFGGLLGSPASFPAPVSQVSPTIVNPPTPPYTNTQMYAFPAHLQLPYTLQWNMSLGQSLGKPQALTLSWVGAHGARLLEQNAVNVQPFNANFGYISFLQNGLTSDYDALQTQFQRRLNNGLHVLASYTWSHSIDYGSYNAFIPYRRGNSDFDVRHSFTSAFMYDLPTIRGGKLARAFLEHWGIDDRFTARTAFPVTLNGNLYFDPATGQNYYSGLNTVPGEPLFIYGSQCSFANGLSCPGGQAINPNAFALPSGCTSSSCLPSAGAGDAPRNFVRGFGAWQMDFALRREFPIHERLHLQFRAEAFNVFNHPNFGAINPTYCAPAPGCTFGQATATLANSLGGLSPIYQMGGPRSLQVSLKLAF
jgi:hypothetical protein